MTAVVGVTGVTGVVDVPAGTERLGPMQVSEQFRAEQLVQRLGIELLTCEPGLVVGRMPVHGNRQPAGVLHGGASAVLAETLGSVAAMLHADVERGGTAVGQELSCTHHRWVAQGYVTGVSRPLHEGRRSASYHIEITDDAGRPVSSARLTCAVRPAKG